MYDDDVSMMQNEKKKDNETIGLQDTVDWMPCDTDVKIINNNLI